ncbi:hypothetical protein BKA69DRAFT_1058167 [Paraphysoderma sedebokerense]|nr:hypothetical protein BKA69DRAFT_1058167 [Paraphysoderma sedebokerense]
MPFIYDLTYYGAQYALKALFHKIIVNGNENVPKSGPCFFTHNNMVIDPGLLIITTPNGRQNHYWAKSSIWAHPVTGYIFDGLGAVPVERNAKQNENLFQSTVNMLAKGELMGIFPEGTSYTLPHMIVVKDGISWAALEYALFAKESNSPPAPVIPVGLNYIQKDKWRSVVIVTYGTPIYVDKYVDEFVKDRKATVKKVTQIITEAMKTVTLNAPDWESLNAARMARRLTIPYDYLDLTEYLSISQSFITLFSSLSSHPSIPTVKQSLLDYYNLLRDLQIRDTDVTAYLTPSAKPTFLSLLPSFIFTFFSTLSVVPILLPGLLLHSPLQFIAYRLIRKEIYVECNAQIMGLTTFLGLPILYLVYIILFSIFYGTSGLFFSVFGLPIISMTYLDLLDKNMPRILSLKGIYELLRHSLSPSSTDSNKVAELVHKRNKAFRDLQHLLTESELFSQPLEESFYNSLEFGPFNPVTPIPPYIMRQLNETQKKQLESFPKQVGIKLEKKEFSNVVEDLKAVKWNWDNVVQKWKTVDETGWPKERKKDGGTGWYKTERVWIRENI